MNIPGYQLGRQVAARRFSKVYNALQLDTSRTVTIQAFDPSLLQNRAFVAHFQAYRARLVGRSFGIMAPVIQASIDDAQCYVISEFFPCPEQLPEIPAHLSDDRILGFGRQIAETLTRLHQAGGMHGGIERDSLFLPHPNELILSPVALQRTLPELRPAALMELSLEQAMHVAPEAHRNATPASDFYGLGVVLYTLLAGRSPFSATDRSQLEEQQRAAQVQPLDERHGYLEPLVQQLMAIDPNARIQNVAQFAATLDECGVKLPRSAYEIPSRQASVQSPAGDQPDSAEVAARRLLWPVAIGGILIAALLVLLIWPEPQTTAPLPAPVSQVPTAPNPVAGSIAPPTEQPQTQAQDLYLMAARQMQDSNPGAALMTINSALDLDPEHADAMQLKQRIEQEIAWRSTIAAAERQLAAQHLTQPPGDNAFETFQALARELPDSDQRAQQGLEKIARRYQAMAEQALQNNELNQALEFVGSGLRVLPEYQPLADLEQKISTLQNERARQQRLALLQRQRQAQERQRIEALERERREQERQLARQQEAERQRQARIDALLESARVQLASRPLTLVAIDAARQDYQRLTALGGENPRIVSLRQDIVDAYVILANSQKNAALLDEALQTLERGMQFDDRDTNLRQIYSETTALQRKPVRQREEPAQSPSVPIIPTF